MAKKSSNLVESLDIDMDDFEENGFIDGDIECGKAIATFSFGEAKDQQDVTNVAASSLLSTMRFTNSQRGATPAVDGEMYTFKRCYQFRESTLRKLNKIKAKHPDVNVYLNTVIDVAISYYYDNFISKHLDN